MVTTVLGKVAVTPKGEWNGTTAYEKLDVVSYGGSSYLSVRDVPAGTSLSNTNYWMLLAQKGDTGNAIASIEKTATSGLTDTYTITFTNGNTTTFTVTNGEAATVIVGTVATGAEGTAVVITNSGDEHDAVLNFTIPRGNTGNGIQGIELTSTSGGVKTYTITFTDGETFSFDVTDGEVTETRLAEALEDYALTDGYYEDLVSGGTEQILSSVYEEDSEPYLFRTSGGSMDIGDREEDTIVGGTVAWNQAYPTHTTYQLQSGSESGLTINVTNGFINISGEPQENTRINVLPSSAEIPANHVCLMLCDGWNGFAWGRAGFVPAAKNYYLNKHTTIFQGNARINVDTGTTYNIHARFCTFDLTQMFGTAIADYIYSLEQANEGAGVAWFKKLFNKPYYEYNTGELLSVSGLQSHDMVGFNAWDEEWELGTYNETTGAPNSGNQNIRSKNFIPVISGQNYYFTSPQSIVKLGYDADKNYIGKIGIDTPNVVRTIPENCAYIKFYMYKAYGTTYNHDICINLSWDGERDGEYEPYVKHSYPLDDSLTLRGIPKLDANNNLYYDGDIYEADGTVARKYGIVDLGTLTWTMSGVRFYASYSASRPDAPKAVESDLFYLANAVCAKYELTNRGLVESKNKSFCIHKTGSTYITVHDETYADAAAFKTAMNGVYLVYELATPTTEEAEPYQTPQIVDDFGTEEYVTDSIVPVGHVTKYMPNLKAKLEMAPDSPSENGDFVVRHTNGLNEYVPLVIPTELPTTPSEDGTYHLKLTIANGTATLAWEAE